MAGALAGLPVDEDGLRDFGALGGLTLDMALIALLLPITMLAARWVQRRPAGTLSSVQGRVRWRWLGHCLLVAVPAVLLLIVGSEVLVALTDGTGDASLVSSGPDWPAVAITLLVGLAIVPFQAAAEEYVFRGWLAQAVGAYLRSPWIGIAVQAPLFAIAHGWAGLPGFLSLTVMGVVCGWLALRTGGLEAAVALHVVNNLVGVGLAAAYGTLDSDETMANAPWQLAVVDIVVITGYALVLDRLARRRGLPNLSPEVPAPVMPVAAPYPGHPGIWPAPRSPYPGQTDPRIPRPGRPLPRAGGAVPRPGPRRTPGQAVPYPGQAWPGAQDAGGPWPGPQGGPVPYPAASPGGGGTAAAAGGGGGRQSGAGQAGGRRSGSRPEETTSLSFTPGAPRWTRRQAGWQAWTNTTCCSPPPVSTRSAPR